MRTTKQDEPPLPAAIVFPRVDPDSTFEGSEYWPAHANASSSNGPYDGHDGGTSIDPSINAISYPALSTRARRCANRIESQLDELRGNKDGIANGRRADSQPIVAIAVPEGPFLPLAVLALHMIQLRHYDSSTISSLAQVPILLPIDPDEPLHRMCQILEDAIPNCILCATDFDVEKMNGAVSAVSGLSTTTLNINELLEDNEDDKDHLRSLYPWPPKHPESNHQVVSHICFTSGTSGRPKGCTSSLTSLLSYLKAKNFAHGIDSTSVVFLASSISFDPCFSDILATLTVGSTLAIAPRSRLYNDFASCLAQTKASHVLCTPTLWSTVAVGPGDLSNLEVVALGGERIPKQISKRWARRGTDSESGPRLLATYGTTEACVYQTCGEIFVSENNGDAPPATSSNGQDVGLPLAGNIVRICSVSLDENCSNETKIILNDVVGTGPSNGVGEVVLAGSQLDCVSGYWNRPDLTKRVFIDKCFERSNDAIKQTHYRTGDLGYLDANGRLYVLGRIAGEDGMVKINGVRIELGEVESAIVDDITETHDIDSKFQEEFGINISPALVIQCAVSASSATSEEVTDRISLTAYCVLSEHCLGELGIRKWPTSVQADTTAGIILAPGSTLYTLLRVRTASKVRKGCVPSNFVLIAKIPLGKTGKCDRKSLPKVEACVPFDSRGSISCDDSKGSSKILRTYGKSGTAVSKAVAESLNLPPSTESSLASGTDFAALGGDSLAATRVVRSIYASHHSILNARHLGGKYGNLEGAFAVRHLLSARTLGDYVDWLDSNGVCGNFTAGELDSERITEESEKHVIKRDEEEITVLAEEREKSLLYEALLDSTIQGHTSIALNLLDVGADPNYSPKDRKDQRMGKLADKRDRKSIFQSSPLHLACAKGDDTLVLALVKRGAKTKVPDAAGGLPLLLNCSSKDGTKSSDAEDERRLRIARLLLEYADVPLSAKDASRQTILHAGARSGHPKLLRYLMSSWTKAGDDGKVHIYPEGIKGGRYDWQDRWFRTPVHWAVLNGNVEALGILLEGGCSPNPCRPKASVVNRKTSAAVESPIEICARVHGDSEKGAIIRRLLEDKMVR